MIISLDYDDTYTKAPQLWNSFIKSAKEHGHEVLIVTMRHPTETLDHETGLEVHYTGRKNKHDHMKAKGKHIDIWIDDMPWFIHNDAVA